MSQKAKLVVIGNGMAGGRFLEELVLRGGTERYDIVVFGEEPYGNYNRILLSGVLAGSHQSEDIMINAVSWYEAEGIKLYSGIRAGWIDRISKAVYAAGGISESYDKLVIATGSSPYIPPLTDLNDDDGRLRSGIFPFRTLDDCQGMIEYASAADRVLVVGGGLLGLEAARGLSGRGLEVHVAHLNGHLMDTQLDQRSGELLKEEMERLGIHIHLERLSTAILGEKTVTGVAFRDGGKLDCDMVVIAAGIRPNVDLAKQAGFQVQHGIVVKDDLSCRNDPNVYAIGECAQHRGQLYGLVSPLWEQAQVLAERLSGQAPDAAYRGSRISTRLKVMGVDLAVMGDKEPQSESDELVHYSEPARGVYKKLIIRDGKLAGAILLGDGLTTPGVLQAFERGEALPENRSELLFPMSQGSPTFDISELPSNTPICNCNGVSKGKITEAVQQGLSTLQEVCDATRAGTGCGGCKAQVRAVVEHAMTASDGGIPLQRSPEPLETLGISKN